MKNIKFNLNFIKKKGHIILLVVACTLIFSCTNDDEESLNPPNPCDTVAITYSGVIQPILQAHCYGCHSGSSPQGGVALDTYDGARDAALDGSLGGTVNWEPGYSPMPRMQDQLDSCKLYYINTWINEGAPNN